MSGNSEKTEPTFQHTLFVESKIELTWIERLQIFMVGEFHVDVEVDCENAPGVTKATKTLLICPWLFKREAENLEAAADR